MAKNMLIDALRANDKTGHLFQANGTSITYKTGFPVLDHYMGSMVNVFDNDGKVIDKYPSLGVQGGSIVTIVGKSHVGKSTLAIQMASNIVRPFANGTVIHYDLERSTTYTRIGAVSKFSATEMKEGKYILRQENSSIEEIKMSIAKLYKEKTSHPEIYKYDTGKVNEFGEPIEAYEPTCLIIDSVPSLNSYINENTKDGNAALEEISTQTDKMRLTAEVGRFLSESMEMLKTANITMFLINHIKTKPGMGMPTAPELQFLKSDETLPCGKAVQYYSHMLIRLTSVGAEKYEKETDGFDGFGVTVQFIKNRGNINGTIVAMVFDKVTGYDSLRTSVQYASSLGMVGGNKNGYYFGDRKDMKFTRANMHKEFAENRELYKIMYSFILPPLREVLSSVDPEEAQTPEEEMDY